MNLEKRSGSFGVRKQATLAATLALCFQAQPRCADVRAKCYGQGALARTIRRGTILGAAHPASMACRGKGCSAATALQKGASSRRSVLFLGTGLSEK